MIYIISGKARHGKDTTAQIIINNTKNCIKLAYADYIKLYVQRFFGWDGREETKNQYRELLQTMGTEVIRQKLNKPNFHVNRVIEDIEILSYYFDNFVISDCRFPNECDLMKEKFEDQVELIRVIRDNYKSELTDEQQNHHSETALDNYKFDCIIHATDLAELEKEIIKKVLNC